MTKPPESPVYHLSVKFAALFGVVGLLRRVSGKIPEADGRVELGYCLLVRAICKLGRVEFSKIRDTIDTVEITNSVLAVACLRMVVREIVAASRIGREQMHGNSRSDGRFLVAWGAAIQGNGGRNGCGH